MISLILSKRSLKKKEPWDLSNNLMNAGFTEDEVEQIDEIEFEEDDDPDEDDDPEQEKQIDLPLFRRAIRCG